MPRYLSLSNGRLLVNFDQRYYLRDLYWPHVGNQDHTQGAPFRFGLCCDGQFSWIADSSWEKEIRYLGDTLVGETTLRDRALGLALVCRDVVDVQEDAYLRHIEVIDTRTGPLSDTSSRSVRLFFCQEFHICNDEVDNTSYYDPDLRCLFHYKNERWFLIDTGRRKGEQWEYGVEQWTVGKRKEKNQEAWREAPRGALSGRSIARGNVDSAVALDLEVPAGGRAVGGYWIVAAPDCAAASRIEEAMRTQQPETLLDRTQRHWQSWVRRERAEEADLPPRFVELAHRSLLVVQSQCDAGGGIIAATDFDTAESISGSYAYVWPRDGAFAAAALIAAGLPDTPERFLRFCHAVMSPQGYLLQRFNPDRSLAATWLSWFHKGQKVMPVQGDETPLVLWTLRLYFEKFRNEDFLRPLYDKLVVQPANWLMEYTDERGLPQPSWGLWEQWREVHAWGVGAAWGALQAAARFAEEFGPPDLAARCTAAADRMQEAAAQAFWNEEAERFVRALTAEPDEPSTQDMKLDVSVAGLWYFGMFEPDDPRIVATMKAVHQKLSVSTPVGGLARYEKDPYHQVAPEKGLIPGNPWFVSTLWLARWYTRKAQTVEDLEPAAELIRWAASRALPNGLMAEQIHPVTGEPLSACPLTWSHATFLLALYEYAAKHRQLQGQARYLELEPAPR